MPVGDGDLNQQPSDYKAKRYLLFKNDSLNKWPKVTLGLVCAFSFIHNFFFFLHYLLWNASVDLSRPDRGDRGQTCDCLQLFSQIGIPSPMMEQSCTLSGSDGVKIHWVDEKMRELLFLSEWQFLVFLLACVVVPTARMHFMNYIQCFFKVKAPLLKSSESSRER